MSSTYQPGALIAQAPPARAITLGCLDVLLTPSDTFHTANSHHNVVIGFAFGNRCDHAVPVDFGALAVVGFYGEERVPLFALDPRHEVHPAMLGGRTDGHETFEFEASEARPALPDTACVTLDGLTPTPLGASVTRCFTFGDTSLRSFGGDVA